MNKTAAAYIRRSSVSGDSPGDASREAQQEATRRLASAFASDAELVEYVDWGISGRKDDRPEYVRLKREIAAGKVCCVFAYSLSRLGRTARELDALFTLCEEHEVQVITQADGTLTASSATGKFLRRILSELAELESELAKERIGAALDAKRARGDELGRPVWGFLHVKDATGRVVPVRDPEAPVEQVLAAVEEAGTILGAVRLLNEQEVPAPKGETWHTSALTRVVKAHAPELLNGHRRKGRPAGSSLLAGLVRCHCGQIMTPNARRRQLYCYRGNRIGVAKHGRAHVREGDLLPWIMNRASEVRESAVHGKQRAHAQSRRLELIEQRERLGYALTDGLLTREQAKDKAAVIDGELAQVDSDLAAIGDVPDIGIYRIPDIDPATFARMELSEVVVRGVHDHLRSLMRHVQLSNEMRPVSVEWIGG